MKIKPNNLISILLSIILLSSCVTQKRCLERFPVTETHDTLIVYKPGIIPVPIPGTPVISVQTPINLIPSVIITQGTIVSSVITDTVYAVSGTAHARAWVVNGRLNLEVNQSDSIYIVERDSLIRELQIKDTEIYTIQQECESSKVERVLQWAFYIALTIAFIVLIKFFMKLRATS